mgnify:CR=1 FL=1
MNIRPTTRLAKRLAFLQLDVAIALTVLALVFIPLSVSSSGDLDLARRHYFEAVALQLIDGEMDVLLAGCLLYTSPSPRDGLLARMPSSA